MEAEDWKCTGMDGERCATASSMRRALKWCANRWDTMKDNWLETLKKTECARTSKEKTTAEPTTSRFTEKTCNAWEMKPNFLTAEEAKTHPAATTNKM